MQDVQETQKQKQQKQQKEQQKVQDLRASNIFNERSALVKRLVETRFQTHDGCRRRAIEWTILQMLAPLCAPESDVKANDVDAVVELVLEAKKGIDALQQHRMFSEAIRLQIASRVTDFGTPHSGPHSITRATQATSFTAPILHKPVAMRPPTI